MAQELLLSGNVGELGEVTSETRLHRHVLRRWINLAEIGSRNGIALFRKLFLVKDRFTHVVQLHGSIDAVDETKFEVG